MVGRFAVAGHFVAIVVIKSIVEHVDRFRPVGRLMAP
jgi:hypothetical protein